jgi:hypothetical protein
MQKWEYCAIVGMAGSGRNLVPYYPALWYFDSSGFHATEIKGDELQIVAQTIAKLGEEGWEMVGAMPFTPKTSVYENAVLFFKRPQA